MKGDKLSGDSHSQSKGRIPPGQRITSKFPVLHAGRVPEIDISEWTFTIEGLVKEKRVLDHKEFTSLEQVETVSDIHCVTGWSRLDNRWEGVSSSTIGDLVAMLPEARFVIIHSVGGFTTNLSLDDFFQPDVVFATKHNGEPLTREHGYPVRLVVPKLYFWKSAKWVTGVEFVDKDRPGFWETRGYHNRGDPWLEERYSQ